MTDLSTIDHGLPAILTDAETDAVRDALEASRSQNTKRAYASAWATWAAWATEHRTAAMPAEPAMLAAYLAGRARGGATMATVRMAQAAISAAHRLAGHDTPMTEAVRETVRGLSRQAADRGEAPRQAAALTDDVLGRIEATACNRRPRESEAYAAWRGAVDIALARTMRDAGLRRSEAAALTWADVQQVDDGSGRIAIARSKTDQEGDGAVVAITTATLDALGVIRPDDAEETGPVFGLSPSQISRRVASAGRAAGVEGLSGHSGRVGLARRMVSARAPLAVVMRQGRWVSTRMVARYTRAEAAGEALQYLD